MRPTTPSLAALSLLMLAPAIARAQSEPVCLSAPGAADSAYSAEPIAAPGCTMPARYDVSFVDGCVGVYGAQELIVRGGLVIASGPSWGATIDARGPDPVVIPNCAGATPVALAPVSPIETSSVALRAALLGDSRPDVRAAALEATARDQGFEVACAELSAFILDAPSFGAARRVEARRALELAKDPCLAAAAFEVASDAPTLNPDAQRAIARTTPDHDARELAVLRLVTRGVDAEVLASSLTQGASLKLSTALVSIAQDPTEAGSDSARRVLDVLSVSYDIDDSPPDDSPNKDWADDEPEEAPGGLGLSFNVGWLVGDQPFRDPLALTLWGGVKLFPDDANRRGLFFAPGIQLAIADTGFEVVPTARLGWAYIVPPEVYSGPDILARSLTAVELYTLLGIRTPLGGQNVGVRVGVGAASPLLLIFSLISLGNLSNSGPDEDDLPFPNGIELLFDADVVTGEQIGRVNLTVGF